MVNIKKVKFYDFIDDVRNCCSHIPENKLKKIAKNKEKNIKLFLYYIHQVKNYL